MNDQTESFRREMVIDINSQLMAKQELEARYGEGNVFDTEEVRERWEVLGFMAPFVAVRELETGTEGTLLFQHSPRFYFDYQEDSR